MKSDWLRGCKLRQFKKWYGNIGNDGLYYTPLEYENMIDLAKTFQIGDEIYNIYKAKFEKIKGINAYWDQEHKNRFRIFRIEFTTETGYIIYDINDKYYADRIEENK